MSVHKTNISVRQTIETAFRRIGIEQSRRLAPITGDLPLLNSGSDSLCFALLVANLEDELGVDPFTESEDVQVPVTFAELVKLYEHALKVS